MLFKLHYFLITSGICAPNILVGVFLQTYTNASPSEIGAVLLVMPFSGMIFRPIICSKADREQKHQLYLMKCLFVTAIAYTPFVVLPFFGPELYENHSRGCLFVFVGCKLLGDIALGGVLSIGDSLAINYASRIGTSFTVYRVWGTISWMTFGIIIGQINETPYLPKYVPAFMILIVAHLLNLFIIWLWPGEYFRIVPKNSMEVKEEDKGQENVNSFMKALLPKEVVIAHMKAKLLRAIPFLKREPMSQNIDVKQPPIVFLDLANLEKAQSESEEPENKKKNESLTNEEKKDDNEVQIDKITQFRTLIILFRRDSRIILYLMVLVVSGSTLSPLSFFFLQLEEICNQNGTCNFSQLVGFLQVSMAGPETILFLYIQRIKEKIGRVNLCALGLFLALLKHLYYGTIYTSMNPYFALLAECLQGIYFGIYLISMVELGHLFANEVPFIIPELVERGIVQEGPAAKRLELSLSATMQAIVFAAQDGVGRGCSALIYGLIVQHYSYHTLWMVIVSVLSVVVPTMIAVNLYGYFFKPQMGFDHLKSKSPQVGEKSGDKQERGQAAV